MNTFNSLGAFAAHLIEREIKLGFVLHEGLELVAAKIEKTAKDELGSYQPEVGPFPEWEGLADSTMEDRANQGFPADEPLLRTGELRDSITHEVNGDAFAGPESMEAIIGSTSDIAIYQEFGTATIPPRPFIGPAVIHNEKAIQKILGAATVVGLTEGTLVHNSLGYDIDIEST